MRRNNYWSSLKRSGRRYNRDGATSRLKPKYAKIYAKWIVVCVYALHTMCKRINMLQPIFDKHLQIAVVKFCGSLTFSDQRYPSFATLFWSETDISACVENWYLTENKTLYLQVWQWKLDSNLPGRLGQIGDWLYRAEELLDQELSYTEKHEDNADMLRKRLDHHKVRFSHLI